MKNLLQKISNNELLNMVSRILARPGDITVQDTLDLAEINTELARRDNEFFSAIQNRTYNQILGERNGN